MLLVAKTYKKSRGILTDTTITSIIATYQQRIAGKQYLPATAYGCPTLGANCVPSKLFRVFFTEHDVVVQFFKVVGHGTWFQQSNLNFITCYIAINRLHYIQSRRWISLGNVKLSYAWFG